MKVVLNVVVRTVDARILIPTSPELPKNFARAEISHEGFSTDRHACLICVGYNLVSMTSGGKKTGVIES